MKTGTESCFVYYTDPQHRELRRTKTMDPLLDEGTGFHTLSLIKWIKKSDKEFKRAIIKTYTKVRKKKTKE